MTAAARRGLFLPSIVTLIVVALLIALGTWQLQRKAWKDELIATLRQKLNAAPVALPPPAQWPSLQQARDEFTRVKFRADYAPGKEAVVWATGSGLRDDVKGPGVFIFTPVRLSSGETVIVNRGFVADQKPTGATQRAAPVQGPAEITGIMRWPEPKAWQLSTPYDRNAQLWFVRDHLAMATEMGWGGIAPFYIEREAQTPTDGLASPGRLNANLPNNHLQYALTWYALAMVLIAVFGFWVRSRRQQTA